LRRRRAVATLGPVPVRPLVIAIALLTVVPPVATARGGSHDEVRVAGTCGGGVRSELRVKADGGAIELELRVQRARRASAWRVTLVQEGRVVWRGSARAGGGSGEFRVRRGLRDLAGADRLSVRASGPGGVSCRAAATLQGD
jgi:hypothetical protein